MLHRMLRGMLLMLLILLLVLLLGPLLILLLFGMQSVLLHVMTRGQSKTNVSQRW